MEKQLAYFKRGLKPAELVKSATINNGIKIIKYEDFERLTGLHKKAADSGRIMKFVPASGAATRMFKKLETANRNGTFSSLEELEKLAAEGKEELRDVLEFFRKMNRFAFYDEIISAYKKHRRIKGLRKVYIDYKDLLEFLISPEGMNFPDRPKALIKFHKYEKFSRTALEEHLVEAIGYSADSGGNIRMHFTISPEHLSEIEEHVEEVLPRYTKEGFTFDISFSVQKKSTDTIAVDHEENPFMNNDGTVLFRPGGHGALLENLMETGGDIVFIKNIDNVVPDQVKDTTILYKKLIAGHLIYIQEKVFGYLKKIKTSRLDSKEIDELISFAQEELNITLPGNLSGNETGIVDYYKTKLNRPVRVCGMVLNQGAPGGGPFWIKGNDGSVSLQIIEGAQIDKSNPQQCEIFNSATHFNPVDIVCGLRDYVGDPFDLKKFRDDEAVFISQKSKDGRELKALELPGLWNGGMYDWITIFIEVPKITFSPVKEVNDLLLAEHQA